MGQQQLMLLLLVTVVVGIMTVVAITLFDNALSESNKDIIRQDMMEAATIGQLYFKRPIAMGGGGGTFNSITLNEVQLDTANAITRFSISETSQSYFKITADPTVDVDAFTATVYRDRIEWE